MKTQMLKAKLVEKGINVDTLATNTGINRSALYRKFNNFERITIGEANKIKNALELTDEEAVKIFLS